MPPTVTPWRQFRRGNRAADGDGFGTVTPADGHADRQPPRARSADGDRATGSATVRSSDSLPTGATVATVCRNRADRRTRSPRPVSRFHRSDGHGFAVAIFRQSPPTVTPTGAPVRRPDLPPTGSDGDGFGQSPPPYRRQVRAKRATTARPCVPAVRTGSRPSRSTAAPCAVPVRRGVIRFG